MPADSGTPNPKRYLWAIGIAAVTVVWLLASRAARSRVALFKIVSATLGLALVLLLDRSVAVLESLAATKGYVEEGGGRYALVQVPAKIRVRGPLCTWPDGTDLAPVDAHLNATGHAAMAEYLLSWDVVH